MLQFSYSGNLIDPKLRCGCSFHPMEINHILLRFCESNAWLTKKHDPMVSSICFGRFSIERYFCFVPIALCNSEMECCRFTASQVVFQMKNRGWSSLKFNSTPEISKEVFLNNNWQYSAAPAWESKFKQGRKKPCRKCEPYQVRIIVFCSVDWVEQVETQLPRSALAL